MGFKQSFPPETSRLISRFSYYGPGALRDNLEYQGRAEPGSATSDPVWFIANYLYDSRGNLEAILHADGDNEFNNVWDNRAILSYS